MAPGHSGVPSQRWGDLLPLPIPYVPEWTATAGSRTFRRRTMRERRILVATSESVLALNRLAGFCCEADYPAFPGTKPQHIALKRIQAMHRKREWPLHGGISPRASLDWTLRKSATAYQDVEAAGSLVSYEPGSVSLPRDQSTGADILDALDAETRATVLDFPACLLKSPEEISQLYDDTSSFGTSYHDPAFDDPGAWARYVREMFDCGLIHLTDSVSVINGVFFVLKKSVPGKPRRLRMILDCRNANLLFRHPPRTVLGSVESLGRVRIPGRRPSETDERPQPFEASADLPNTTSSADIHEKQEINDDDDTINVDDLLQCLFMSQDDVQDFFYRLSLESVPELAKYFGLPLVDCEILARLYEADGLPVPAEIQRWRKSTRFAHPCMSALSMGWSWAFHLAQCVHEEVGRRSVPEAEHLADRKPAPEMRHDRSCLMLYADNGNHLSLSGKVCEASRRKLAGALETLNLKTHETVAATTEATTLGVKFDGFIGNISATPERDSRLDQALLAILEGQRLNSDDMRKVVGHVTCRLLLRRPILSVLHHVYSFINAGIIKRIPVWDSVWDEIRTLRGMLVFAFSDLRRPTSGRVTMFDASLSGYGVGESNWELDDVNAMCALDERWRFRDTPSGTSHREVALEKYHRQMADFATADILSDVRTVRASAEAEGRQLFEDFGFPNIPARLLKQMDWKNLWACPLNLPEAIHMCEARGALSSVKHRSRDAQFHSHHMLFIGDNLGLTLALSKGRCADFYLLKLLRRVCAELCASDIVAHFRWTPSETNCMDKLSRLWEGARLRACRDGASPVAEPRRPKARARSLSTPGCGSAGEERDLLPIVAAAGRRRHEVPSGTGGFLGGAAEEIRSTGFLSCGEEVHAGSQPVGIRHPVPRGEEVDAELGGARFGEPRGRDAAERSSFAPSKEPRGAAPSPREERCRGQAVASSPGEEREGPEEAAATHVEAACVRRAPEYPGGDLGGPDDFRGLPSPTALLLGLRRPPQVEGRKGHRLGRCRHGLGGPGIPERRVLRSGRETLGRAREVGPLCPGGKARPTPTVPPRPEELAEELPEAKQAADARRIHVADRGHTRLGRPDQRGVVPGCPVFDLSAADRAAHPVHGRPRVPAGRSPGAARAHHRPLREGEVHQDGLLRRDHPAGRRYAPRAGRVDAAAGRGPVGAPQGQAGRRGGAPVGLQHAGFHRALEGGRGDAPSQRHGDGVPDSTRRGQSRPHAPASHGRRGPRSPPPFDGRKLPHLQQARPGTEARQRARQSRARLRFLGAETLCKVRPRWRVPRTPEQAACGRTFLSLYGGVGHAARYMSGRGLCTCEVDKCFDSANDLSSRAASLDADLLAQRADVLGVELDCSTYSLARRGKVGSSMPQRLRSRKHPWGLPGLTPADQNRVQSSNYQTRAVFRRIKASIQRGASGYLENPIGSILWHLVRRAFSRELARGQAAFIETDMCCYGTSFMKPTRLLIWCSDPGSIHLPRCHMRNGICGNSGRCHEQLSSSTSCKGLSERGQWKTKLGQVYPKRFVSKLLSQFCRLPRSMRAPGSRHVASTT